MKGFVNLKVLSVMIIHAFAATLFPFSILASNVPLFLTDPLPPPLPALYSASPSLNAVLDVDEKYGQLSHLNDGEYNPNKLAVFNLGSGVSMGDDYYIDIVFERPANADYIVMLTNKNTKSDQSVRNIRIDYLDPDTNNWVTNINDFNVSAYDDGDIKSTWADEYGSGKIIPLNIDKTIGMLRIYLLNANRTWGNFRIDELGVYGVPQNIKVMKNLLYENGVTITDGLSNTTDQLADGIYMNSPFISPNNLGTAAIGVDRDLPSPYRLEFDFGSITYRIDSMRIYSAFAGERAIVDVDIKSFEDGAWVLKQNLRFERETSQFKAKNAAFDYIELETPIEAQRLAFDIKGVRHYEGFFQIDEMELFGENADSFYDIKIKLNELSNSRSYSAYVQLQQMIDDISNQEDRAEYMARLDAVVTTIKENEFINPSYDILNKIIKMNGYLFWDDAELISVEIKYPDGSAFKTVTFSVNTGGDFSFDIDISEVSWHGDYNVRVLDFSESVLVRAPSSAADIVSFHIDGVAATISSNVIKIILPTGGVLVNRTPVFQISEYAKLYINSQELASGISLVDFTGTVTLKIVAEDGTARDFMVSASVTPAVPPTGSSSSGSGGGGRGIGAFTVASQATAVKDTDDEEPGDGADEKTQDKSGNMFVDVDMHHWAYEYILNLKRDGIVQGNDKGEYNPESAVIREEFAVMLVRLLKLSIGDVETVSFHDVIGHWSEEYIRAAVAHGLIYGETASTYGVGKPLTRQDLAVIIARAVKNEQILQESTKFDDDEKIAEYAKPAVYQLRSMSILEGFNNEFDPLRHATRAEVAKLLSVLCSDFDGRLS